MFAQHTLTHSHTHSQSLEYLYVFGYVSHNCTCTQNSIIDMYGNGIYQRSELPINLALCQYKPISFAFRSVLISITAYSSSQWKCSGFSWQCRFISERILLPSSLQWILVFCLIKSILIGYLEIVAAFWWLCTNGSGILSIFTGFTPVCVCVLKYALRIVFDFASTLIAALWQNITNVSAKTNNINNAFDCDSNHSKLLIQIIFIKYE